MSKFKPNRSFVAKFIPLYGPYNALSMGKKTPKISPSLGICVTRRKKTEAPAIGSMHKNLLCSGVTVGAFGDPPRGRLSFLATKFSAISANVTVFLTLEGTKYDTAYRRSTPGPH